MGENAHPVGDTDREWAEDSLLDAVDRIAEVQNHYDGLTDEMEDMLEDSKSGIAAVYMNLDEPVQFDLDRSRDTATEQSE